MGRSSRCTPKAKAEPVLVAWGIDTDGHPVFLGLAPGAAESADAWCALLDNLKDRGLGSPLLVISDGGSGLCAAIECSFPASLHQRCLVHYSDLGIMPTRVVEPLVAAA
jgi:putative transposase